MADNAATELKNSALFQAKWDEQIGSAPKAINSLAALLAESTTSSPSVRPSIIESGDIGRRALYEGIQHVEHIQLQSRQVINLPMQLLQAIYESEGDPSVGRLVVPQLNTIRRAFQDNARLIAQVTQGFDRWARSVAESQELGARENVSDTLKQSLEQLRQQTGHLVSFFGAYRSLVETADSQLVRKLFETADTAFRSGQGPSESQRSELVNSLVAVRLYLFALASAGETWAQLSQDSIVPGLRLLDELEAYASQGEGEVLKRKSSEVERWSEQATGRIEEMAREKQKKVLEDIEKNAQKLKDMLAN